MKDEDDDALGLDLQARMRSSLDLEYNHQGTSQEKWSRKYTHKGIFSAQYEEEKDEEDHVLNTYMGWKKIKMML